MIVAGDGIAQWVCAQAEVPFTPGMPVLGCIADGVPVAGVVYTDYTGASISMHSVCVDRKKISREFFWAIFDYPFRQLAVKRVTGLVSTANLAAQRVDEHLGFRREALLKDYFPNADAIIYVMRKEDCRWLALAPRYRKETT